MERGARLGAAAVLAWLLAGCGGSVSGDGVRCGAGTVQQGDLCVVAEPADGASTVVAEAEGTAIADAGGGDATQSEPVADATADHGADVDGRTADAPAGDATADAIAREAGLTDVLIDHALAESGVEAAVADAGGGDAPIDAGATELGSDVFVPEGGAIDGHRLVASDNGVAFASMPELARLSQTITVTDTLGLVTPWSAASDQPWLSVTPAGQSGGSLVLSADPTGLAPDTVYYASVVLSSGDPTVQSADTVRVGLWVGSVAPSVMAGIATRFTNVVADPIRPYAYLNSGGTDITVYNVYTAEVAGTIAGVAPQLANMAVSTDGSRLFVVDATNFAVVPIDLDADAAGAPWSLTTAVSANLVYGRTGGKGFVFAGNGVVFDAASGARQGVTFDSGYYGNDFVAVSQDGSRLCALDNGLSPYTLSCYALGYTDASGGALQVTGSGTGAFGVGSNGNDVAVNPDGTRVFVASGAPYEFDAYDATMVAQVVQSLPGDAYPNNVEITDDGRIVCGAMVWYDPVDAWVYDATGFSLGTYRLAGYAQAILPGQLKVSGDGLVMIGLTDDPALQFVLIGP